MTDSLGGYFSELVARAADSLGPDLAAVWSAGSLVTGGFDPARSDVDVLVACRDGLSPSVKEQLTDRLRHRRLPCPAHGLDLVVWSLDELREPGREPRYECSLATGSHWKDDFSSGGPYPGGLIDLAIVRQMGTAAFGPPPREVVGEIPRTWLLEELMKSLGWHRDKIHDPFHDPTGSNAVLNVCRALHFLDRGAWVSKVGGARWLLRRDGERIVIGRALAAREGGGTVGDTAAAKLDRESVLDLLDQGIEAFRVAGVKG